MMGVWFIRWRVERGGYKGMGREAWSGGCCRLPALTAQINDWVGAMTARGVRRLCQ